MEVELRIYEVEPGWRWNWLDAMPNDALGRYLSYRDDATFATLHASGAPVVQEGPSALKQLTIRRLVPAQGSTIQQLEHFRRVPESALLEIRQYRLRPGTRARFATFLRDRTMDEQARYGMLTYGPFEDLDDENVLTWLRGFPNLFERERRKAGFYQSSFWYGIEEEAFSMIEDYSNVLLVMPV